MASNFAFSSPIVSLAASTETVLGTIGPLITNNPTGTGLNFDLIYTATNGNSATATYSLIIRQGKNTITGPIIFSQFGVTAGAASEVRNIAINASDSLNVANAAVAPGGAFAPGSALPPSQQTGTAGLPYPGTFYSVNIVISAGTGAFVSAAGTVQFGVTPAMDQ